MMVTHLMHQVVNPHSPQGRLWRAVSISRVIDVIQFLKNVSECIQFLPDKAISLGDAVQSFE